MRVGKIIKQLRYVLEAVLVYAIFALFRVLPLDMASAIGGWLGRNVAIFHRTTGVARNNLRCAIPELSGDEIEKIIIGMWDNIGRTVAEYPHFLGKKIDSRIDISERVEKCFADIKSSGRPVIFVAGHIGNWEITPRVGHLNGMDLTLIYRHINNPYIDKLIRYIRLKHSYELYPKGRVGAQQLVRALKERRPIGLLVDQKMNDGIAVPFFGREAMTAPATAQLSLKYGADIYLARVIREGGAYFRFDMEPLTFRPTKDKKEDIYRLMVEINRKFEEWIREYPAQWFWVHNRWPKSGGTGVYDRKGE